MRLIDIAELTGGELCKGNPNLEVTGIAAVSEAAITDITFFSVSRYLPELRISSAGAAFVPRDFSEDVPCALIKVESPSVAFAAIGKQFAPPPIVWAKGIHPTAIIDPQATLGEDVAVHAYAVIEAGAKIGARTIIGAHCFVGHETVVGEDCFFNPRVIIRERCLIGNRVIFQPGAIIGADGFGYELINKKYEKIAQTGIVQIDDDVEVGANSTIDRARFGKTWIKEGTKIDNLVMIGHNSVIGPHAILCGLSGVSGSSKVGGYVTLAGQVGVAGHVEIGDHAILAAQTGVSKNIPANSFCMGSPAEPVRKFKRKVAYMNRIEELFQRVKALEGKK